VVQTEEEEAEAEEEERMEKRLERGGIV